MKSTTKLLAGLIAALGLGTAQAAIVNAGFETGDLTGWTSSTGGAFVTNSHANGYGGSATYLAQEGDFFLAIASGAANVWQTASQSFSVGAGQTLSGLAAFNWGDYSPYNDGVRVRILDIAGSEVAVPFYFDGSLAPASGFNGDWTEWSWTAATAGTYTLEFAARNTIDSGGPEQTYGYFDASASSVPEPGSLALFGLALAGLAASRRRTSV